MGDKSELLHALMLVKERQLKGQLDLSNFGICYHIMTSLERDLDYILIPLFQKWPKFSGYEIYPIPDPKCPASLIAAKCIYMECEVSKWLGAYGRLRIELLDFLISELEKELNK